MKLNAVEKALMNNPLRAGIQRRYEARVLERFGGQVAGGRVLEIGCGRGVGVDIIVDRFRAATVVAFDLDPDMVERARARLARSGDRVSLSVGDAGAIDQPDATFDAVFDFGTIHPVPDRDVAGASTPRPPADTLFALVKAYTASCPSSARKGWSCTSRNRRRTRSSWCLTNQPGAARTAA